MVNASKQRYTRVVGRLSFEHFLVAIKGPVAVVGRKVTGVIHCLLRLVLDMTLLSQNLYLPLSPRTDILERGSQTLGAGAL